MESEKWKELIHNALLSIVKIQTKPLLMKSVRKYLSVFFLSSILKKYFIKLKKNEKRKSLEKHLKSK